MTFIRFTVPVDGGSLVGQRRDGAGTPLVLVHGFGGSRHDWEAVIAALPTDLPLIAYDQRGFGDSISEGGVPFSHADDLLALLDSLAITQADLCGISLGGGTVLHAALDAPQRVRRLVLVSPMIVGWSWSRDWIERWKAIGRAARAGDIATARALWWRHPLFASTRDSDAAPLLRAAIEAFPGQQWVQDDQRPELPNVDRLTELAMPTLLLTGALDVDDFRLIAELIAAASPNVSRIDQERAGHLLTLEAPAAIASDIVAFLRES